MASFPTDHAQAASCNAYVADASYGNSDGYAYSHAVASCSSKVDSPIYAVIFDASESWLSSNNYVDHAAYFSVYASGYFCATLAPGLFFPYSGSYGHLYPLWTCW